MNLGPITLTKQPDTSSTQLFVTMCNGTHIAKGTRSLVKAGSSDQAYITLDMTEVFVTGFQLSSAVSGEIPTESVSLSYKSILYTYLTQKPDGSLVGVGGRDVSKNQKNQRL